MQKAQIINISNPQNLPLSVVVCSSIKSKFLGLMFRKEIHSEEGIILVESSQSRLNSAIHMMFMNFDIAVIWIDERFQVVDRIVAKRWVPAYIPRVPAKFTLELHTVRLNDFRIGDRIVIKND